MTQKSTKTDLVSMLIEVQRSLKTRSHALAYIIDRARSGKYHDWDSDLDTPKIALVADLEACRALPIETMTRIKNMVTDGDFDEEPTEKQLAELREHVGAEEFDKLFPSSPDILH